MTRIVRSCDGYKNTIRLCVATRIHESSASMIVNNNYRLLRYTSVRVLRVNGSDCVRAAQRRTRPVQYARVINDRGAADEKY